MTRKCPHVNIYEKYLENEERNERVDLAISNQDSPEETSSDTVSESGGSEQSNDDVEEGGQAERGKHKKYWVSMFLFLVTTNF